MLPFDADDTPPPPSPPLDTPHQSYPTASLYKVKTKKYHHEVESILEERASTGKAKAYFLVQWAGYHPSWEAWRITGLVGEPVATWETLAVVKNTEALTKWRDRLN